jgi:hypothetical protein
VAKLAGAVCLRLNFGLSPVNMMVKVLAIDKDSGFLGCPWRSYENLDAVEMYSVIG